MENTRNCPPKAKAILVCGKICSGKSTYAKKICTKLNAVILSVDEITLALFGPYAGDMHDTYCERTKKYLFRKSLEIIGSGINVILDWGFWQKKDRNKARSFYAEHNIESELHYLEADDELWSANIKERNEKIATEEGSFNKSAGFFVPSDYFVDEELAAKFQSRFEPPDETEVDVRLCLSEMRPKAKNSSV